MRRSINSRNAGIAGNALSFQRRDNSLLAANIPGGVGRHKGEACE
jgi:hypothetical protein